MTRADAVKLCAWIEAACPSQRMAELTPDVWCTILPASFTLDEALGAAVAIIRRGERWVDIGAIIAEVRRARGDVTDREHAEQLRAAEAHRAQIEARDAAFLRKVAARTGGVQVKAIPPPDYGGPETGR